MAEFDLVQGEQLRDEGKAQAAAARYKCLLIARRVAYRLCQRDGKATADDVYKFMDDHNLQPELLGPASGSIFLRKYFEFTGEWVPSARVSNHARMLRVWKLKS